MRFLIVLFSLTSICVPLAYSGDSLPNTLKGVGFDQRLDQQIPLDLPFRDEFGRDVHLSEYFSDKPVILVLVQYQCPMLCGEILNGLTRALLDIPLSAGKDFNVLTVSFDSREKPDLAAAKKKSYIERYGRPGAEKGWHFLTGEDPAIRRLTEAVGFRYTYDAKHDRFAHASGIMVVTPSGKLSHYFYDIKYSPRDVRLGLVEASEGKIGSPVDQILLYCFHYDPADGKYGPAIMNLVRAGGVLTLLCIGMMVGGLWQLERRRGAAESGRGMIDVC